MGQPGEIHDESATATAPATDAIPPHLTKKYEQPSVGGSGSGSVGGSGSGSGSSSSSETNPVEHRRAWQETVRDGTDPSFGEVVIENQDLPCSVDDFFDAFLRDEASHPFTAYQRDAIGDEELEVSPWVTAPADSPSTSSPSVTTLTRTIRYRHPVNAGPMAPPSARATRHQTLRRFGTAGLVVDTRTTVTDVPISDCFHVDDRLQLEPSPTGGTILTAKFEVVFVKRTMFKKIVKLTTSDEVRQFWLGYVPYVQKALLRGGKSSLPQVLEPEPMLDAFLAGLEETVTAPLVQTFEDCREALEEMITAPLTQALEGMTAACCAAVVVNGPSDATTTAGAAARIDRASASRAVPQEERSDPSPPAHCVELTYLPGLGRELKDSDGKKYDEEVCRRLIRGAMVRQLQGGGRKADADSAERSSEWECLCERVFAAPEGTVGGEGSTVAQAGEEDVVVGHSAFEDAVVAALMVSWGDEGGDGDQSFPLEDGRLPSTEVALFE